MSVHSRFFNLTDVPISKQEIEILKKDLKHIIEIYDEKKEVEHTIVDAEMAISLLRSEDQDPARHICRRPIEKDIKPMGAGKVRRK